MQGINFFWQIYHKKREENNFLKIVFLHSLRFMYQIHSGFLALKIKVGIKQGTEPCAIKTIKS